jgi:hypothetical protein
VALGQLAMFLGLRVRPDVALGQKIIMFFSTNTFNDNKHNNLCTPNNNIFDINSLNYKKINIITFNYNKNKNKNICATNNNIFNINTLKYNRNSNIYNTNNSTNINTFNYNKNDNIYGTNNNNNNF